MDVGLCYLGSFSQVSHLMVNTHHRVKKKPAGEKYKGKKHQGAASRHIRLGRSHSGPPAPSATASTRPCCTAVMTPRWLSHWTIRLGSSPRIYLSCNLSQKATPERAPLKPGGKPKRKQTLALTQQRGEGDSCNDSEVKSPEWWL